MKQISLSSAFVEYTKTDGTKAVVRRFQKDCLELLFQDKTYEQIISFVERNCLPDNIQLVILEKDSVESFIEKVQKILETSDYIITVSLKDKPYS